MEKVYELFDAFPFERWCLQQDIDDIVQAFFQENFTLPDDIVCLNVHYPESEEGQHFTDGATLTAISNNGTSRIFTWSKFYTALLVFMENWLHDIAFKEGGRIDVDEFSLLDINRIFSAMLD